MVVVIVHADFQTRHCTHSSGKNIKIKNVHSRCELVDNGWW